MKPTRSLLYGLGLGILAVGCAELEAYANRDPERREVARADSTARRARTETADRSASDATAPKGDVPTAGGAAMAGFADDELIRSSRALPTGDERTSAVLLEKIVPREVMRGVEFEYVLSITNLTEDRLESVVVEDEISSNLRLTGGTPAPSTTQAGIARWNLGVLEPHETVEIRARGTAGEGDMAYTMAQAQYRAALRSEIAIVSPSLELEIRAPKLAAPGSEFTVEYIVRNSGSGYAREVVVNTTLPTGLVTKDGSSEVSLPIRDLGAGESEAVSVAVSAKDKGSFNLAGDVSMRRGPRVEATAQTVDVKEAQLALVLSSPAKAFLGRPAAWKLTAKNGGEIAANDVRIDAKVPAGMRFVNAEPALSGGPDLSWSIGELAPGAERTVTLYLQPEKAGSAEFNATATADLTPSVDAKGTTEVEGMAALQLSLDDLNYDPVLVGDSMTYTVKVLNQGTAAGANIQVTMELDEGMTLVNTGGATNGQLDGRHVAFRPLTSLGPDETATWKVVVRSDRPGDLRMKASLTSDILTRPVVVEESTVFYE